MHSQRPLPALALVMPHPQLPSRAFHLPSPHTPRAGTPSTPIFFPKQIVASPRTSSDSWGSSNGNGEDDAHWEWKPEQMSLLGRTLDALPGHLLTPFYGAVPPSNLLDKIARSVSQAQGPLEWPHSIRATRRKLVEIARARDKDRNKENITIDEQDEDGVIADQPKKPLYRQSSMDFLPSRDKGSGSLSRLSSRLQRTDRVIPAYHPYARPASRSPSPPVLTPRSPAGERTSYFPATPIFAPSIPQRTLRPRTSSNSLGSRPSQVLRRSASSMSTLSTHSSPIPSSTLAAPMNVGVLSPTTGRDVSAVRLPQGVPRPGVLQRAESYAASTQPTLKRAPSFGATSIPSVTRQVTAAEKQAQDPESDEEEKVREKKVKRPRTRSTHGNASSASTGDKKREKKPKPVSKDGTAKSGTGKTTSNAAAGKARPQVRGRSGSMFGPELPMPQPKVMLPSAATSSKPSVSSSKSQPQPTRTGTASPPPTGTAAGTKTLRRVKTTAFNLNLGTCPTARRISFGSLEGPSGGDVSNGKGGGKDVSVGGRKETGALQLGSAIQLS